MSDLIERQKTIDALELTTWYHQNRNGEMVKGANNKEDQAWYKAEDVYKVLKDAPSVQPEVLACGSGELNVQPEPKWIPCSERLPEVGTYVLVSKKALGFRSNLPNVCTAHRSCDPRSGKEEWNDMLFGKLDDDDVLAWMSLPEPWKEGGQE